MRAYLQQLTYRIKGSYWFIPSLMVIGAILLSQFTIWIDRDFGNDWLKDFWFVSMNQPDGARALLATVAGSMITVAGVTFSLTILAVSHATSHFGPRLLDNFMRDRGNQVTLGTFVATFLYCLLVLRVVRGGGESNDLGVELGAFVPQLSLLVGLVLTIASVAELIYFIHHVPDSIHISTVLQRLAVDMDAKFDELYPETLGDPLDPDQRDQDRSLNFSHTVESAHSGYLQGIDDTELLEFAKANDCVLRLLRRPGDFLRLGERIVEVTPVDDWSDDHVKQIQHGFTIGFSRTPTQDAFFTLNEFVEVATRALSPGVNDPFTAMQCIDWLSDGLVKLSRRQLPKLKRVDSEGDIRIIISPVGYIDFVDAMLGQLVPYASRDENVRKYFIDSMERVIAISEAAELNQLIKKQIHRISTVHA
ncbi:hypothetical protein Pla22_25430 [Rubripirellula amarantea]|uniref:DUF2254 domain-containing protein n=1 Tax=Rubripirellula amarantea TaxID=2527999 RepID=A0A5C5WXA4_9BACT|nr:DUF2254 domain-containing protein [Rubripirellula amarantea]TWT54889.1 hypothetical protein Pla22_25430 [Rubripirellula amarantea]